MQNEILNISNAITKKHNGSWMVYNRTEGMVHMIRLVNGKPAPIAGSQAAKNLLNLLPTQYAEIKAVQ